jgi:hypothetical protein
LPVDGRHKRAARVGICDDCGGRLDGCDVDQLGRLDGRELELCDGGRLDGCENQVNGLDGENQVNGLDVTPEQLGSVEAGEGRSVGSLDAGDGCDQLGRGLSVGAAGRDGARLAGGVAGEGVDRRPSTSAALARRRVCPAPPARRRRRHGADDHPERGKALH